MIDWASHPEFYETPDHGDFDPGTLSPEMQQRFYDEFHAETTAWEALMTGAPMTDRDPGDEQPDEPYGGYKRKTYPACPDCRSALDKGVCHVCGWAPAMTHEDRCALETAACRRAALAGWKAQPRNPLKRPLSVVETQKLEFLKFLRATGVVSDE